MTPLSKNMASDYKIFWTNEAIDNLESILGYLNVRWTQCEIDNFKKKLAKHQTDQFNRTKSKIISNIAI